jgi:hypothetical protein
LQTGMTLTMVLATLTFVFIFILDHRSKHGQSN